MSKNVKTLPLLFLIGFVLFCTNNILISVAKTKQILERKNVVLVDVRRPKHYKQNKFKLPGAERRDFTKFDSWYSKYSKEQLIILYWAWPNEFTSAGLARKFREKSYSKVFALKGGWDAWVKAGYPVEEK